MLGQVLLDADLTDGFELGLEPVGVLFLGDEDLLEEVTGAVVGGGHAGGNATVEAFDGLVLDGEVVAELLFDVLADQEHGAGGEIQLTDAMIRLAKTQPFFGLQFEGRSFDCGSKPGFLAANIAYGMDRADLAQHVLRQGVADIAAMTAARDALQAKVDAAKIPAQATVDALA